MAEVVAGTLDALEGCAADDLQGILRIDAAARRHAAAEVERTGS